MGTLVGELILWLIVAIVVIAIVVYSRSLAVHVKGSVLRPVSVNAS